MRTLKMSLATMAAILLLSYGGTWFMATHESWFEPNPQLPVIQGQFKDRALLADADKNQDAIVEECRSRFGIKEKFRYSSWKDGHLVLHYAALARSTDVEIVPQDGRLKIQPATRSFARILIGLHQP